MHCLFAFGVGVVLLSGGVVSKPSSPGADMSPRCASCNQPVGHGAAEAYGVDDVTLGQLCADCTDQMVGDEFCIGCAQCGDLIDWHEEHLFAHGELVCDLCYADYVDEFHQSLEGD